MQASLATKPGRLSRGERAASHHPKPSSRVLRTNAAGCERGHAPPVSPRHPTHTHCTLSAFCPPRRLHTKRASARASKHASRRASQPASKQARARSAPPLKPEHRHLPPTRVPTTRRHPITSHPPKPPQPTRPTHPTPPTTATTATNSTALTSTTCSTAFTTSCASKAPLVFSVYLSSLNPSEITFSNNYTVNANYYVFVIYTAITLVNDTIRSRTCRPEPESGGATEIVLVDETAPRAYTVNLVC